MSLAGDILWSWRRSSGAGLRRQIDSGAGEERALGWLMLATVLIIAAQAPASYRNILATVENPDEVPIAFTMSAIFTLFLAPLAFYGIAALAHLGARLGGAKGPFLNARLGLFWALLCLAPLWLVASAVGYVVGPMAAKPLQYGILLVFLVIWADTMTVAESLTSRLRTGLALGVIGVSLTLIVSNLPTG